MPTQLNYFPQLADIRSAAEGLKKVAIKSPLAKNLNYSRQYGAEILFKREDLQTVRSYKIRGAYNKISSLSEAERDRGVVTASAGNHAQGVAFACSALKIRGTIFMPSPTPNQKVEQVKMFGGEFIEIVLEGDTFDDSNKAASAYCKERGACYVHPFDDEKVIEGQATIGLELLEQSDKAIDYIFVAVGGGGLSSGLCAVFSHMSPKTKIIGVEPTGAPSMSTSIKNGVNTELDKIDKFIDGAAVRRIGDRNFAICKEHLHDMITIDEGQACLSILNLYNKEGIVVEPAGALSIAALDHFSDEIKGKNVVCIVSGSNNDITRTQEIRERALIYNGLKHYFLVRFPQRAGALREFLTEVLSEKDDITYFSYNKKDDRETGPAVVGIRLTNTKDLAPLIERMKKSGYFGQYLNDNPDLLNLLS